ncbi:MAG: response regulator transcription factor [Hydrogenophilaceae bacterium]|nr:response regulator transcription factor [Hydrogenophilaceae bacterium]
MKPLSPLLIVEDDGVFAKVLAKSLAARGLKTVHAVNSADALKAAREQPFAAAVLDLKLENETSLALIPALKALYPDMRILMLTGYASIQTAVEAIKLGATHYLPKPASVDEILAALSNEAANPDMAITPQPLSVERLEWEHIQRVLAEHDGNISATARALNMHRRTLQRKLSKKPVKQ